MTPTGRQPKIQIHPFKGGASKSEGPPPERMLLGSEIHKSRSENMRKIRTKGNITVTIDSNSDGTYSCCLHIDRKYMEDRDVWAENLEDAEHTAECMLDENFSEIDS